MFDFATFCSLAPKKTRTELLSDRFLVSSVLRAPDHRVSHSATHTSMPIARHSSRSPPTIASMCLMRSLSSFQWYFAGSSLIFSSKVFAVHSDILSLLPLPSPRRPCSYRSPAICILFTRFQHCLFAAHVYLTFCFSFAVRFHLFRFWQLFFWSIPGSFSSLFTHVSFCSRVRDIRSPHRNDGSVPHLIGYILPFVSKIPPLLSFFHKKSMSIASDF